MSFTNQPGSCLEAAWQRIPPVDSKIQTTITLRNFEPDLG
jgi:hypothetical protein